MAIQFVAVSKLPTEYGEFNITAFQDAVTREEHIALSVGTCFDKDTPVLIRVHSECLTGDSFASLKCDCGPQLHAAMKMLQSEGGGIILYLKQEGRGIGLTNKIRAYALQDQGHDTVDANLLLGLPADARNYEICKIILDHFNVGKVRLMTNNPQKVDALKAINIDVVERVPLLVGVNVHNLNYLQTKKERMQHIYRLEKI